MLLGRGVTPLPINHLKKGVLMTNLYYIHDTGSCVYNANVHTELSAFARFAIEVDTDKNIITKCLARGNDLGEFFSVDCIGLKKKEYRLGQSIIMY
jgi:hypothetical protein